MAEDWGLVSRSTMAAIGNAIRQKGGAAGSLSPAEMQAAILSIGTGGAVVETSKRVSGVVAGQTVNPSDGYDVMRQVIVDPIEQTADTVVPSYERQQVSQNNHTVTVEAIPAMTVDTSDGNAAAADITKDKIAFVRGQRVVGTNEGGGGGIQSFAVMTLKASKGSGGSGVSYATVSNTTTHGEQFVDNPNTTANRITIALAGSVHCRFYARTDGNGSGHTLTHYNAAGTSKFSVKFPTSTTVRYDEYDFDVDAGDYFLVSAGRAASNTWAVLELYS